MKAMTAVLVLGVSGAATAAAPTAEKVVSTYVKGIDRQDVKATDKRMHKDFRTVVFMPGKDVPMVLTRDAYLGMLKQKKIGGDTRKVTVHSVVQEEKFFVVTATYNGKKADFRSTTTWVDAKSGPQLVEETVQFLPKGKS